MIKLWNNSKLKSTQPTTWQVIYFTLSYIVILIFAVMIGFILLNGHNMHGRGGHDNIIQLYEENKM